MYEEQWQREHTGEGFGRRGRTTGRTDGRKGDNMEKHQNRAKIKRQMKVGRKSDHRVRMNQNTVADITQTHLYGSKNLNKNKVQF